ncbi:hypothetical protein [Spongiactinospora sp. TRM90649]|uniref:hypothetical protein n=1 Tax=Spongiactinospora sp. TRM90649 TaxID=3031114 RepID=UPI0023F6CE90|nr:hypothetical protein [Spongiactinospora sp. TRM90649]MDF5752737.1 hypothetical protein [Spongiactinospora sp. TRM90649]
MESVTPPAPPATSDSGMDDTALDDALRALAGVTERVMADHAESERLLERLSEEDNRLLEERAGAGWPPGCGWPDPARALSSFRQEQALSAAHRHRAAAREFAAWWADVAASATVATLFGLRLHPVRAAAADPESWMSDENLRRLPAISRHERNLAELTLWLGRPAPGDAGPAGGRRPAAELGLTFRAGADGRQVLAEDGRPEARRRRLWGRCWLDHQVPLLPETGELVESLTMRDVPRTTVSAIREASSALDAALAAKAGADRLSRQIDQRGLPETPEQSAELESLWDHADRIPALLAAYARTLTDHLPAVRAARAG